MSKYIVEVDDINTAHWFTRAKLKEVFAKSKEVVEVLPPENDYNLKEIKPDGINSCRWEYYGKPVKLYAAKVEDK